MAENASNSFKKTHRGLLILNLLKMVQVSIKISSGLTNTLVTCLTALMACNRNNVLYVLSGYGEGEDI